MLKDASTELFPVLLYCSVQSLITRLTTGLCLMHFSDLQESCSLTDQPLARPVDRLCEGYGAELIRRVLHSLGWQEREAQSKDFGKSKRRNIHTSTTSNGTLRVGDARELGILRFEL